MSEGRIRDTDAAALTAPEEPLLESAPIARRIAPSLCWSNPVTGLGCAVYHALWQYHRLMNGLGSGGGQLDFFLREFSALARSGRASRVLVTATNDYALPAYVIDSYKRAGASLDLTVHDRCETPLYMTRWYADRVGTKISTACTDMFAYDNPGAFDVLTAAGVLKWFRVEDRARLAECWYDLLRPGGTLVVSEQVTPGSSGPVITTPEETAHWVAEKYQRADEWRALGVEPDEMAEWSRNYARNFTMYAYDSIEEMMAPFEAAGFRFERPEESLLVDRLTLTGPRPYARLIGVRE